MALCIKYSVSHFTILKIYYIPLLYFESGALTSQVYASSAMLQLNKDIQKVMPPFSGITSQPSIVNISELLPDLWWIDRRPYSATLHRVLKIPLPWYKME
jgi:hypothetical protein